MPEPTFHPEREPTAHTTTAAPVPTDGATTPSARLVTSDRPAGDHLGRYEILGEVGRGGMGVVLRARDAVLDRELAVKVLHPDAAKRPDLVRRFLDEARIAGQLQHPGVAPVHELGSFGEARPYFTMKLVKGQTLADLLQQRHYPTEDLPRFLAVFEQVCQTVAFAHSKRIIHRDLKPANVMVGAFGEVQVMDWGLAKVLVSGDSLALRESSAVTDRVEDFRGADATPLANTTAGTVMGTLAFMPPEQARGEIDRLDERADVFGLGAILCVILTGRPPYTTAGPELLVAVANADLGECFARLDACRADPELSALAKACLAAEPDDRPRDGAAVARTLTGYLGAMQERLRAAELERASAEARAAGERKRRRLTFGLAAAILALVVVGGVGAWWAQHQREASEAEQAVRAERIREGAERGLDQIFALVREGRWAEADAVLTQAENRVGEGGSDDLRARVEAARKDFDSARAIDAIRQNGALATGHDLDPAATAAQYKAAFRAYGVRVGEDDPAEAGRVVRDSPVRDALVAGLDDWIYASPSFMPIFEVLRSADPDPFRTEVRGAIVTNNRRELARLAERDEAAELPPSLLVSLVSSVGDNEAGLALCARALERHPGDFWLNFGLGNVLLDSRPSRPADAARYFQAAVAIQPKSRGAHYNLAKALFGAGDAAGSVRHNLVALAIKPDDAMTLTNLGFARLNLGDRPGAIACFRDAVRSDPHLAKAHGNLGVTLYHEGDIEGAITSLRRSLQLESDNVGYRVALGLALRMNGDPAGAEHNLRAAVAAEPDDFAANYNLGLVMNDKHDRDGAARAFRAATAANPTNAMARLSLAGALDALGDSDGALNSFRAAVDLDPHNAKARVALGVHLLWKNEFDEALGQFRTVLNADPGNPMAAFGAGTALLQQGNPAAAEPLFQITIKGQDGNAEAHCNLGLVLGDLGKYAESRDELRRGHELGSKRQGWNYPSELWLQRAERRVMLHTRLGPILNGADPASAADRLDLARMCLQSKKLPATAVRLYTSAFAVGPSDDPRGEHRYHAAGAALRAADGAGDDAKDFDVMERDHLCRLALGWARAELSAWEHLCEHGPVAVRGEAAQAMRRWLTESMLADARDPALAKWPADERAEWRRLWGDVTDLLERCR
jgi:tetratricopeptide (TPR) repeat protein